MAEVSLHPCSTVRALPDDGVASAALVCTAMEQLVSTSLPSTLEALLAAFFLQLRSAHLGICWEVYCAAQPSRGVCLRVCLTMPEQRCYHMQGKAAQTKRGPAPWAVAPVKVNAKPGVRQNATHTTRTSMTKTSTGAMQVGLDQIRHGLPACLPASSGLPCTALSNHPSMTLIHEMHQHASISSSCHVQPSGGEFTNQRDQYRQIGFRLPHVVSSAIIDGMAPQQLD